MNTLRICILSVFLTCSGSFLQAQTQTGVFRTTAGNTSYHQFVRDGSGAAVYINQVNTTQPILRLISGTAEAGAAAEYVRFTVENDGKVGIGTSSPREMLSVNGKIRAKEIKVETTNWPDYVFTKSYHLPSLTELENFIQQHQHLPGMPTAEQAEREGVSLGEMNKKLLEKVEELTLLLIEQHKRLELLEKKDHEAAATLSR